MRASSLVKMYAYRYHIRVCTLLSVNGASVWMEKLNHNSYLLYDCTFCSTYNIYLKQIKLHQHTFSSSLESYKLYLRWMRRRRYTVSFNKYKRNRFEVITTPVSLTSGWQYVLFVSFVSRRIRRVQWTAQHWTMDFTKQDFFSGPKEFEWIN